MPSGAGALRAIAEMLAGDTVSGSGTRPGGCLLRTRLPSLGGPLTSRAATVLEPPGRAAVGARAAVTGCSIIYLVQDRDADRCEDGHLLRTTGGVMATHAAT